MERIEVVRNLGLSDVESLPGGEENVDESSSVK